ncbi:MAG: glycosyltransferase family 39 protein [Chloroflexota bacterium]|nr:glycosyltransferase family 39 protein [Chloroflexota bacterium]
MVNRPPDAVIPVALYLLAATVVLVRIGEHPAFPYNWESYTAWHYVQSWAGPDRSAADIFSLTDGLMTDSGRGPLVGLPVWFGFSLDQVGLAAMRWPVALVAALAAPLIWAVGRRLVPEAAAVLAALLLVVSPVFLLYGRTATLVGISLVPALLTMLMLVRVLESSDRWRATAQLGGLQACLIASAYAYAPVRLLWPLTVAVLLIAAISWRQRRRFLLLAAVLTMTTVPAALVAIDWLTIAAWDPWVTIAGYFRARGEHVFAFGDAPDRLLPYLRQAPAEPTETWRLALGLLAQNAGDLLRLLADWQTEPVVTNHWSPRGGLWSWVVAPFFWLGLGCLVFTAIRGRSWRSWLLLFLLLGLTMPLLFTTRVHVGRLVLVLPLLLLVVSEGWALAGDGLGRLAGGRWPVLPKAMIRRVLPVGLAAILVLASAVMTIAGYAHTPATRQEARQLERIAAAVDQATAHGGAAVIAPAAFGLEIEGVRAGTYWLALHDAYRVIDLTNVVPGSAGADRRPPLYVVGVLPRLLAGELPNACRNLYLVLPEAEPEFREALSQPRVQRQCPDGLRFDVLPV